MVTLPAGPELAKASQRLVLQLEPLAAELGRCDRRLTGETVSLTGQHEPRRAAEIQALRLGW